MENESGRTENYFFLGQKITWDGTNNQFWNYIDPWVHNSNLDLVHISPPDFKF